MKKSNILLVIILLLGFTIRTLFIWLNRPEFVGWFNHTYYYYVQTHGLIESGSLPFSDMPLLFHLYAFTSKALISIGVETKDAVVHASRFWMCLIPSLLPLPIFVISRRASREQNIPRWTWVLLFASAFYPLSILYIPEFLQKNALGILLLAVLIYQSIHIAKEWHFKHALLLLGTFLLIVFTHYGSAGAAFLYGTAFTLSSLLHRKRQVGIKVGIGLLLGGIIALAVFYYIDIQRFERVAFYLNRMTDSSSLGLIFSSSEIMDKVFGVLMIAVPIGIFLFFYWLYRKTKPTLSSSVSIFWLSNLIFCYLLVLPIYDQLLLGRFSLFLPLPFVVLLFLNLHYAVSKAWIRKVVLGLSVFAVLVMVFGEFMSLTLHNKNKEAVYADLIQLKEEVDLTANDLIIGRNGVEHISNWFLGTKSCVITSINKKDFAKYQQVFILNPTEIGMSLPEEATRYDYMLANVLEPASGKVVFTARHLRLIRLEVPPVEWVFDQQGNWLDYE